MRAQLVTLATAAILSLVVGVFGCGAPEGKRADLGSERASIVPRAATADPGESHAGDSNTRMEFRLVARNEPVAGVQVLVSGDEARCTVTTDADGAFSFVGRLADTYRLSVPSGTHLLPEDEVEGYCRERPPVLLRARQAAIATVVLPGRLASGGPHRVTLAADLRWSDACEVRWTSGSRLRLAGLEPGRYRVVADDAEGVTVAHWEVRLAPGDNGDVALRALD